MESVREKYIAVEDLGSLVEEIDIDEGFESLKKRIGNLGNK